MRGRGGLTCATGWCNGSPSASAGGVKGYKRDLSNSWFLDHKAGFALVISWEGSRTRNCEQDAASDGSHEGSTSRSPKSHPVSSRSHEMRRRSGGLVSLDASETCVMCQHMYGFVKYGFWVAMVTVTDIKWMQKPTNWCCAVTRLFTVLICPTVSFQGGNKSKSWWLQTASI